MTRYAQDFSGAKGSETVKDTVIYTYNADDSMKSSVTYKLATGITVAGNVATAGATAVKKSAAYFIGAKGEEKTCTARATITARSTRRPSTTTMPRLARST